MKATREEMKAEAVFRMKMIGLPQSQIDAFETRNEARKAFLKAGQPTIKVASGTIDIKRCFVSGKKAKLKVL